MNIELSKESLNAIISSVPDFARLRKEGSSDRQWQESLWLFLQALYRQRFILVFDWQTEFAGKERYLCDIDALKTMSLEELRRVLTAHVRLDRLCEGHMDSIAESGYLEALIERLKALLSVS